MGKVKTQNLAQNREDCKLNQQKSNISLCIFKVNMLIRNGDKINQNI